MAARSKTKQHPLHIQAVIAALHAHGCSPTEQNGGWQANCPAHDDKTPSLSVREGTSVGVILKCHTGCEFRDVIAALGLEKQKPARRTSRPASRLKVTPQASTSLVPCELPSGPDTTVYHYLDADGAAAFAVARKDGANRKLITQWTPTEGGWIAKGMPDNRPLYRLPDVLKSKGRVIIVEGEKCVEAIRSANMGTVTTWAGGTAALKKTDWTTLRGRSVAILADDDAPGRKCAERLARMLNELNVDIEIALPDGNTGEDVADWIEAGTADAEIKRLLHPWTPPDEDEAEQDEADEDEPRLLFPKKNAAALRGALRDLKMAIRYNQRRHADEFRLKGETAWEGYTDRSIGKLRDTISDRYAYSTANGKVAPLRFGDSAWKVSFNALLADCESDPFVEWLQELPKWDGNPILNSLLEITLGAEGELAEWASVFLFLGPIQRALEPGCKLDEVPVLVGRQGIGKSALLRQCLPPEHQASWFGDSLNMAAHPKERAEALQGRVIVEASEMAGVSRAELEIIKQFVTCQDDGSVRLAWRQNPEPLPRRCVIVGTSNNQNCLPNDSTGNRRFVPIQCPEGNDIESFMSVRVRGQLWGEALKRYRDGERANLPRRLHDCAAVEAEGARRRDVILEDSLAELSQKDTAIAGMNMRELAVGLQLCSPGEEGRLDMRLQNRLSAALLAGGWTKRRERRNGIQSGIWYPPAEA